MSEELENSIRFLKGIGEKKAAAFAKEGVNTVGDLLTFFPRRYENWSDTVRISAAPPDKIAAIRAKVVLKAAQMRTPGGRLLSKIRADDGETVFTVVFFNNPYALKGLDTGREYIFYGRVSENAFKEKELLSPKYERADKAPRIRPVYRQNALLSSRTVENAVTAALETYSSFLIDALPEEQKTRYRLLDYDAAVKAMHFPQNEAQLKAARRRLVYEELLTLQLGLLSSGGRQRARTAFPIKNDFTGEFISTLPFSLTSAQARAIKEGTEDMRRGTPMRRLLQGDVGSGKTAVAAALMYSTAKNGFQCALMAPTEVLAAQHAATFAGFFRNSGIRIVLLTGSMSAKDKKRVKAQIASGEAQAVIGTHAVISHDVRFKNLALAVTDEQHRFGVCQRAALREKGENPHILVMSATPIPRTLSLIIYGDLDVSVLDEKPAGRKEIKTCLVPSVFHERLYAFIKKQAALGRQSYIVCPAVEQDGGDFAEKKSAEEYARLLSSSVFSSLRTAVLHGRMKQKQKDEIMLSFRAGNIDVLICTVVIEVGTDVPNAGVMVIENAEYFGLSQLHQLRGRVGRGENDSFCILVSDAVNEDAKKRFKIICSTGDGFKIAEEDLKMRGPGDFFGERQSGLPRLKLASLISDTRVLYAAQAEAKSILSDDPQLKKEKNACLRERIARLFSDIS